MQCNIIRGPDGRVTGFVCTHGRTPQRRCVVCRRTERQVEIKLCDAPVTRQRMETTCDTPVCIHHALHVDPDTDYCPRHAQQGQQLAFPMGERPQG